MFGKKAYPSLPYANVPKQARAWTTIWPEHRPAAPPSRRNSQLNSTLASRSSYEPRSHRPSRCWTRWTKDVNTFVMRVREWYSWHFPELVRIVPDNYTYTRLALAIQEKGSLSDERKEELAEITGALHDPGFRVRTGDHVLSSFRLQLRPGS